MAYPPSLFAANTVKKNCETVAALNEKSFENSLAIQVQSAVLTQLENTRKHDATCSAITTKNPLLFQPATSKNFVPLYLAIRSLEQAHTQEESLNKTIAAEQFELEKLEETRRNAQFDINISKAVQKIFMSAVIFGLGWGVSKYTGAAVWNILSEG